METIRHDGREIVVQPVARTSHCRLLYAGQTGEYFAEYPVSVGPYKIDIPATHALSREEVAAYQAGVLDLAEFGSQRAEADQASGRFERKPVSGS